MAVTTKQHWERKLSRRNGVPFPTSGEIAFSLITSIAVFLLANVANGTIKF